MLSRRHFLGALSYPAAAVLAAATLPVRATGRTLAVLSDLAREGGPPETIARNEAFWFVAQQAFTVDRSIVNLNNGGVSPAPRVVQEAMKRHLDYSNTAPPYAMWRVLEPQREAVRERLAGAFGCDPEEIAVTRNASEGLQICQLGFDLKRGDEVLTTNQDYPRMITTWRQRERRDGIVLKEISLPVPAEDPGRIVSLLEEQISPQTRLMMVCHVINLTGQILPVRRIVQMARRHGVPVIVDGAHGFAQFEFTRDDLECDYYATSLHKWLFAPHGTGMLYVKRDKIRGLWPMMAAPETMAEDIRKFEEIGTHPAANALAIAEALTFHQGIGPARKEARLRALRDRWAKRLLEQDGVRLHTSLKPEYSDDLHQASRVRGHPRQPECLHDTRGAGPVLRGGRIRDPEGASR
jgi:selenocysteine lyase/cysteine desulfurase